MEKLVFSPWKPGKPLVSYLHGVETSKLHVQKVLILCFPPMKKSKHFSLCFLSKILFN